MNRISLTTFLLTFLAHAAYADLRYTTHMEVRPAPGAGRDARSAALTSMLQTLMPPIDTRTFVSRDAARVEILRRDAAGEIAGMVLLLRGATQTLLDPDSHTYWLALRDSIADAASDAEATFRRTGEFSTLLGHQVERVAFTVSLPFPAPPPAGVPAVITLEGDLWLSSGFSSYVRAVAPLAGNMMDMLKDLPEGMVMRHVLRSADFGYEVEYVVTELIEEPLPASLFQVPDGFQEIPAPRSAGALGGPR